MSRGVDQVVELIKNLSLSPEQIDRALTSDDPSMRELVLEYLFEKSALTDVSPDLLTEEIVSKLLSLSTRFNDSVGKKSLGILVNFTGSDCGANVVSKPVVIEKLIETSRDSIHGDLASKILSNVSRDEIQAEEVAKIILKVIGIEGLVDAVCGKPYNKHGLKLEYLPHVLANLTQYAEFRETLVDPEKDFFINILSVVRHGAQIVERRGVASAIFNCLYDSKLHERLLEPPVDLLTVILYPLAGPEEFDDEDNEKMPLDLQYLPGDKIREVDSITRNLLLRSLLLLCSTKACRVKVRDANSYLILREYHKWETDRSNLLAAENVIDILIRTEDEIGVDDLRSLSVPDDLKDKFHKMDDDYINT